VSGRGESVCLRAIGASFSLMFLRLSDQTSRRLFIITEKARTKGGGSQKVSGL
jgi:hypothetical protein